MILIGMLPVAIKTPKNLQLLENVFKSLEKNDYLYDFLKDEKELKFFIKK